MASRLSLCRVELDQANRFIEQHHRHHKPIIGWVFGLGAVLDGKLVGVVTVGRPVSRMRDDGDTLEVTRLATDGTRNACSFLYGAAARACFSLGYHRIGTYILVTENGASLKACGWRVINQRRVRAQTWGRNGRERAEEEHEATAKQLFERLNG